MHNIPKAFGLMYGGETRCYILDNHRPFHLANIHSRDSVVVFDDADEIDAEAAHEVVPPYGSDMSAPETDGTSGEDDDDDMGEEVRAVGRL